ncbi:MAG TPA: hypothetical protein VFV86_04005 [Nitrososphaeraceae archaeon]|nr:hypothetical protein [Nitrososphaeraceae archaeon]
MTKDKKLFFAISKKKLCKSYSLTLAQGKKKNSVPILLFVSSVFLFSFLQNTGTADATPSLDQAIQQFQENLQSSINKQIQSVDNITNSNYCSNSISIQTQTNNNGQTSSTTKNTCNNNSIFSALSIIRFTNVNLSGAIVSTEYNLQTGKIINSLFGNWSLKATNDGQIDFKTIFLEQPLNLSSSHPVLALSSSMTSPGQNKTEYKLSNFRVNTVTQQDSDLTFKGTMHVIEKSISAGINGTSTTNTFKDTGASVSILDDRILVINFDKQSSLFDKFRDIPLVGVVIK